jgi:hypothetical protein
MQTFYSALPWIIRQLGLGRTESRKYEISYGYQIGPSYAQAPDRRAQARIINEGTQCVSFSTTRNKINVTGQFLLKDVVLLGAAIWSLGEAWSSSIRT